MGSQHAWPDLRAARELELAEMVRGLTDSERMDINSTNP